MVYLNASILNDFPSSPNLKFEGKKLTYEQIQRNGF